jgi:hypothetical protein
MLSLSNLACGRELSARTYMKLYIICGRHKQIAKVYRLLS